MVLTEPICPGLGLGLDIAKAKLDASLLLGTRVLQPSSTTPIPASAACGRGAESTASPRLCPCSQSSAPPAGWSPPNSTARAAASTNHARSIPVIERLRQRLHKLVGHGIGIARIAFASRGASLRRHRGNRHLLVLFVE